MAVQRSLPRAMLDIRAQKNIAVPLPYAAALPPWVLVLHAYRYDRSLQLVCTHGNLCPHIADVLQAPVRPGARKCDRDTVVAGVRALRDAWLRIRRTSISILLRATLWNNRYNHCSSLAAPGWHTIREVDDTSHCLVSTDVFIIQHRQCGQ